MVLISETFKVADVASFNPVKGFGFCINEAGARLFFHVNQYHDASFGSGFGKYPKLSKGRPQETPGEGVKIVFWDVKEQSKREREPPVGGWSFLSGDWKEFLDSSGALEAGKSSR